MKGCNLDINFPILPPIKQVTKRLDDDITFQLYNYSFSSQCISTRENSYNPRPHHLS